jgi:hypothetical protein
VNILRKARVPCRHLPAGAPYGMIPFSAFNRRRRWMMKKFPDFGLSSAQVLVVLFLMQVATIGCTFHVTRCTDGPLTQ